jgi:hypothetical protein
MVYVYTTGKVALVELIRISEISSFPNPGGFEIPVCKALVQDKFAPKELGTGVYVKVSPEHILGGIKVLNKVGCGVIITG